MYKRLVLALAIILVGFGLCPPSTKARSTLPVTQRIQLECRRDRVIHVGIDSAFDAYHRKLVTSILRNFGELGLTVTVGLYGSSDVQVDQLDDAKCANNNVLGFAPEGSSHVFVNAGGTMLSDNQFQVVVLHEIGHWLGMRHVCMPDGQTTDECSDVGYGAAVMNPYIDDQHSAHFSELDMREYLRICQRQ